MRQTKNLMDINIDALYNILKQNQGDVNDAMGYKKKAVMVSSDPLALVAEKTKVSKHRKKVVVQLESDESDDEDISDLKKITALLAKAFNRKKYYAKPTNNNLRTSSASSSTNKKPEYVKSEEKKEDKKADEKKRDMSKVKCYNCKKEGHFAKDCKKAKVKISTNMVFMAKMEKVLSGSEESSSSAKETIADVIYKFSDDYFQEIIHPYFEKIDSPFQQTSSLKPYVPTVILEKIIIDLEDEVVSLLKKEKENLEIIESLKSKRFESSENEISESKNQSENDCQVVEKGCDNLENSKVIAPGMFKINVSQSISPISVSKTSCASNNVENKTKRKRRKRTLSKQNDKQVNNYVLRANSDFVHFLDLDTLSSVRRPKHSGVIWKKKGSSNTSNVDLSSVSNSKLNKDVKRYSRKNLLSCNNSHHVDTRSAYACNDAINVSCKSRLYASYDANDLFVFDDVSIRNPRVSKMPFRKKPHDSLNVRFKNNSNNSLPRTLFRWIPKMQPLAGPIVQVCLWIIDLGCSKHMTGNRALLTNFVEKFLGTVRLGLEVAFQKSTCFVRNEYGVDFLTGDRSSNLYIIALNEIASNSLTCLLEKASSSQSWLWHQCLSHLNFATINNLVKNNLVRGLPKKKYEKAHFCSACEQGKIHRKHHKSKTAFASNKPLYLLHMDLCGPMRVESINRKRYVLVVVDDYSWYTWVFFLHWKDEASENKALAKFFDEVGITQQFSATRTPRQNGVVERRNHTLVEAARTMLTFANLPLLLWVEAIATTFFTQNRSLIHKCFDKTPYELINKIKPNIKFFHVFGCRRYILNDYDDVGKLKEKGDIGVFVGYLKESASFRIYNK
ncbi:retrovirus-related pol polyprotein from transposon TNT 1-94 [Tanacetum coccineum]